MDPPDDDSLASRLSRRMRDKASAGGASTLAGESKTNARQEQNKSSTSAGKASTSTAGDERPEATSTRRTRAKKTPASRKRPKLVPLPPVLMTVVRAKGYEAFPVEVLEACVSVDNTETESEIEIGSGVCVSSQGLILTAGHVAPARGSTRRVAFANGCTLPAVCIDVSQLYDLSLLKVTVHTMHVRGMPMCAPSLPPLPLPSLPSLPMFDPMSGPMFDLC